MEEVKPGVYQHFKGGICLVLGVGKHSETKEELVFYIHLGGFAEHAENSLWARPKSMFTETIERDGKVIPRFKYLGEQ